MFYRPAQLVPLEALQKRNVEFAREAWRAGIRPDQREATQIREMIVEYPTLSRDLVQVRCGFTTVSASVTCELVEPTPFKPKHGFFDVRVRQLMHERDSVNAPLRVKKLATFLERLLKGSVLETEGLCVLPGRRVWSVVVNVLIMNDAGNVLDAAQWAALAALMHFRRPELTIRGESVTVHSPHERDPVPLSLHHLPICCTHAITLDPRALQLEARTAALRPNVPTTSSSAGESAAEAASVLQQQRDNYLRVATDPTADEIAAAASLVTVAVNAEGQVCALEKGEGCDVPWSALRECIDTTIVLSPRILEVIRAAMAAHDRKREEAHKAQFLWAQKRTGVSKAEDTATAAATTETTVEREDVRPAKKPRAD